MQNSAFYYKISRSEYGDQSPGQPKKRQLRHISMTFIRLEKLLKPGAGGALNKIIQRAQNMDALTALLRAELPQDAAAQLIGANLRENGELMLVASSSAWASRLRFESDQLMAAARKAGLTVSSCRVAVHQET